MRRILNLAAIAIAVVSLVGWFSPWLWLASWGYPQTVKPITAVGLILAGMIGLCPRSTAKHRTQILAVALSYLMLFLLSLVALCLLLGVCQSPALWTPRPDLTDVGRPGHPSQAALAGLTVLALYGQRRAMNWRTVAGSWVTALIVGGIGVAAIIGTVLGIHELAFFVEDASAALALPTAVAFVLLAAALVRVR